MKRWLVNFLLRRLIDTEPMGMSQEEQYTILTRLHQTAGVDDLLRALSSSDVQGYFGIPEGKDKEFLQAIKKGSVLRLRWLRAEMKAASGKLQELTNKQNNDQT